MGSQSLTLDIQTPELPNPMDRIKQKNKEKKEVKLKKKKEMEDTLESARAKVLDEYKIKSIL